MKSGVPMEVNEQSIGEHLGQKWNIPTEERSLKQEGLSVHSRPCGQYALQLVWIFDADGVGFFRHDFGKLKVVMPEVPKLMGGQEPLRLP